MSGRVVLIGLDAFDVVIARRLVAEGALPTLGRLFAEWWSAPTVTPPGFVVGGVWPSIVTGTSPPRHGFYCDLQLVPGTYEAAKRGPLDLLTPPLWSALSSAGIRCLVVDVPISAPSDDLCGEQLVEWGSHDRFLPLCGSPSLVRYVLERFGEYPVQPKCDDYDGDLARLRIDLLRAVESKRDLLVSLLQRDDWEFFVGVMAESHCAGHQFWAVHDPDHPAHDPDLRAQLGDPLLEVYRAMDRALDDVLAAVPGDADVFVVLSHGIGPHYDGDHLLSAILRALDGATLPDRLVHARERAVRVVKRLTRPQSDRRLPLDGGRRFFKVPNNELYGGVRINVRGREPRGRVAPAEVGQIVDELRGALLELENADTGAPLVRQVLMVTDLYPGCSTELVPDLLVDWYREAPISAARSSRIGVVRHGVRATRTGDHRPHGVLFGRSARRAPAKTSLLSRPVPVIDIAPTLASRLGVEFACDGSPVAEWM